MYIFENMFNDIRTRFDSDKFMNSHPDLNTSALSLVCY